MLAIVFFFSSRRRHTRCSRDWSSDVCSSDLSVGRGNGDRSRCGHAAGADRERRAGGSGRNRYAGRHCDRSGVAAGKRDLRAACGCCSARSEEHTSELQSRLHLVCRLLLEKKKKNTTKSFTQQLKPKHAHITSHIL